MFDPDERQFANLWVQLGQFIVDAAQIIAQNVICPIDQWGVSVQKTICRVQNALSARSFPERAEQSTLRQAGKAAVENIVSFSKADQIRTWELHHVERFVLQLQKFDFQLGDVPTHIVISSCGQSFKIREDRPAKHNHDRTAYHQYGRDYRKAPSAYALWFHGLVYRCAALFLCDNLDPVELPNAT
ncbi:hypothetical protein [Falsiruegeria mediterranea]|uniref:hypothetical protein n=1 Tax=Falsiruegeria mediterranea TaxID=1280832 RepID=UPI001F234CAD|nr:hypothetical protein [Falsiruegeria mediterranea]